MTAPADYQDIANEIEKSMSRAMYVSDYADACEEVGAGLSGGADYMDHAPETPKAYLYEGALLVGMFEQSNGQSIVSLYNQALEADGIDDSEQNRKDFGHYMAMQAMGHGVSWSDDHEPAPVKVPHYQPMTACIAKSDLADSGFDADSLDPDDPNDNEMIDAHNDMPNVQEPNDHYVRAAIGLARGLIAAELPQDLDEKQRQKALMVSSIAKNPEAIRAGFQMLGAVVEANGKYMTHFWHGAENPVVSTAILEKDLVKYIANVESQDPADTQLSAKISADLARSESLYAVAFKAESPEDPSARNLYRRGHDEVVQVAYSHAKPESPSLSR